MFAITHLRDALLHPTAEARGFWPLLSNSLRLYKARSWQILERYHRGLGSLMNFTLSLYVMGLSLSDLQEALYHLLGSVLSVSAINRVTIEAQSHMNTHRQARLVKTPPILIVDGVWVDIRWCL